MSRPLVRSTVIALCLIAARTNPARADEPQLAQLIAELDESEMPRAGQLVYDLGRAGAGNLDVLRALAKKLDKSEADLHHVISNAMLSVVVRERSMHDAGSVPTLLRALRSDNVSVRRNVAHVLPIVGGSSKEVIAALDEAIAHDTDEFVRTTAVWSLTNIASQESAHQIQARLEVASKDPSFRVRDAVASALAILRREHAVDPTSTIIALFNDEDSRVRSAAIAAAADRSAVPGLFRALDDPRPRVSSAAAIAIGEQRATLGRAQIDRLCALAKVPGEYRTSYIWALGKAGAAAYQAEPTITVFLSHSDDPKVRATAAVALIDIGENVHGGASTLYEMLHAARSQDRYEAIMAIGYGGPSCAQFAPRLRELLKDPDVTVRVAAEWMLKRF